MTTPQIIAHRGASYLAPENTLVAFRKAMEIGADGVEMDVQKTYDNELVIHHDYMVDMHTDISGQIYDLTMGELKTLDFGSWKDAIYANERIATLQEALEQQNTETAFRAAHTLKGVAVNLGFTRLYHAAAALTEVLQDDPDFVPRVLDAVRAAGLTDRLTLISFHHSQLRQAKQLMPELKVGALTYGAFLSMVLPPPVIWKDLGLVNSMDEPFSEENCIDLRNNLIYRTVADKVDMLRANFPGETVEQVIGHLEEQADVATYIKTLDFPVDIVSCEYHTAYSNPELVNQLHAMGIQAAFWTVDTQDAVRSLLPLGPDCIVTNRPDRVREWVNTEMRK